MMKIKDYDHIIAFFLSQPFGEINNYTIQDTKTCICVIRSCFSNKHPEIFRIAQQHSVRALKICSNSSSPTLGNLELNISDNNGGFTCTTPYTNFEPPIIGNTLAGGKEFQQKNKWYTFITEQFNVFKININ